MRIPPRKAAPAKRRAAEREAEKARAACQAATHFTTTIFVNRGYDTLTSASLEAARSKRLSLEQAANNGRKAMVYAVTPDGFTHLIPDNFNP